MKRPEILSPAGNFEKLKAAILYGADAVYLAGQIFGMRAAADNFSVPEMREAVEYAHERGVKVYLTLNTMPRENEYPLLEKYLSELADIPLDAMIIADIGVLELVRRLRPDMEIHISTQANAVSSAACLAWQRLGAKRIVLARELTLEEIKAIRANIPDELELECFVHGSMCISYSGRCLLSGHLVHGTDGNRGTCKQPCRWNYSIRGYEITEEKRPNESMPIEEVNGETFILASRDTCTVEYIKELCEAGINSFKIEGRMKSAYYTAVVTNTYRMALDAYFKGEAFDPAWITELESVSHRVYNTGYYFADSHVEANVDENNGYVRDKAYIAACASYNSETGLAEMLQRNKVSVGDELELLTPGKVGRRFTVTELYDENMDPISAAPHPYMRFFMKTDFPLKPGDIVRAG